MALPLFVVALVFYLWRMNKKRTEWKDMLCTKEKVVNIFVLIIFPPMASYEYGIGKALMENAISYAKENNCEVVELTSYKENTRAHKFYENNGFINHSIKFKMYL